MFILHSSNKTENLLVHLTSVIDSMPLSNPLTKETFLIQSQGMERWLSQQLASHFGVWGNYEFLFPGKFFSSISRKINHHVNDDLFDREIMLWRFESLLRELDGDCFKSIQSYLSGENKNLKRFQLAQQLAHIFDQYQLMRPDMLNLWQKNQYLYSSDHEIWQQMLWKKITQSIGHKHRGFLWQDIIDLLNQCDEGYYSKQLPERIFIFGLNTVPPLFLSYMQGLARHCDLHFFLLNPAQEYWADLVSEKRQDEEANGHPLLSTLGQQGREFQQILLEQATFSYEPESFEEPEIISNLHQLQSDILNNQLEAELLEKDGSISIHACHSRMREIEVLKNQLLAALEKDTALELRDIVVMAPDIQNYAPFISAIFSDIQYAIADKSMRLSNASLDAFIRFLTLSQSRFGWQSVMDLLEQPVVYTAFSLAEGDLELIKHWVGETHVRWGKSAAHKKDLGLPELTQNTWQATLDRLLMGYAVGCEDEFVDNVLPYMDIEGSSAQALGGLNDFLQLLFKASDEFKGEASLSTWADRLYRYADRLLSINTQTEQMERQQINEILEELSSKIVAVHTQDISLEVMTAWLESRFSESKSSNGFLRGQLTFCSMLPMRSIPFKVIALLGVNEGEFPKIDRSPTFDLIGQNFRLGDRSRRSDDRYQFLEILLSARQQLIVTYKGLSIQNNDELPPSVVISELLDVLENHYQLTDVITQHPLHAFSHRYFSDNSQLFSYSTADYETAMSLQKDKPEVERWWQGVLDIEKPETIDIYDLFMFFKHPQEYFLRRQLGIRFASVEGDIEEREPFVVDGLEKYGINHQWIEENLNDRDFSLDKLQARGLWYSGINGELKFDQQQLEIDGFTTLINAQALGQKIENQAIDLKVFGVRLLGSLGNLYEEGSLFYQYSNLKGKAFMQAWLHHLIISQITPTKTVLLAKDEVLTFSESGDKNSDLLAQLVNIYLQGRLQPDIFFTEATFAYVKQMGVKVTKVSKTPLKAAQEALKKEMEFDPSLRQLYSNIEDLSELFSSEFEEQCKALVFPVWKSVQ